MGLIPGGRVGGMLMKLSFVLRGNPMRFLFNERLFKSLNILLDEETEYFNRNWEGHVWDIGASVGKYTTLLARANPDHIVYAFEPNLNSLYYLAYKTRHYPNIIIVPNALTIDGMPMDGNFDPDFHKPPTGPKVATISLSDAISKFGTPAFLKMDIEGGEYPFFATEPEELKQTSMLIEWHPKEVGKPIPSLKNWKMTEIMDKLTFLEPLSKSEG